MRPDPLDQCAHLHWARQPDGSRRCLSIGCSTFLPDDPIAILAREARETRDAMREAEERLLIDDRTGVIQTPEGLQRSALAQQVSDLMADQNDWRKGVALIASALGVQGDTHACVYIADRALMLRAERDRLLAALREAADDTHILAEGYLHGGLSPTETRAVQQKTEGLERRIRAAIAQAKGDK